MLLSSLELLSKALPILQHLSNLWQLLGKKVLHELHMAIFCDQVYSRATSLCKVERREVTCRVS